MTYNPNIPQPTDRPSNSQADILTNFQTLNSIFGNNHVPFNASSNNGKHNVCEFPAQASDPTTVANELALYSKDVAGVLGLYLKNGDTGSVFPLYDPKSGVSPPNFYTVLPGGLVIQGGIVNYAGNVKTTTSFPVPFANGVLGVFLQGFPDSSMAVYGITATMVNDNPPTTGSYTKTGFTATVRNGGSNLYNFYVAIGY